MQKPWCSRRGHDYLDRLCGWEDWVNCWEARKLELDLEWWVDTGKAYIEKEQQEPGGISREMALRVRGAWRAWSGPESHIVWCNRSREYMRNRKWRTRKIKWPWIRLQGLCTPPWGLCLLPSRWQHSLRVVAVQVQGVSNSLQPHGLQHARLLCPSPSLEVCPSSCPLNQWCHPTLSSSIALFSFCLQSFPASGSFPVSCTNL